MSVHCYFVFHGYCYQVHQTVISVFSAPEDNYESSEDTDASEDNEDEAEDEKSDTDHDGEEENKNTE